MAIDNFRPKRWRAEPESTWQSSLECPSKASGALMGAFWGGGDGLGHPEPQQAILALPIAKI